MTRVLGIETSCDETGVAVVEDGMRLVAHELASQADIHATFGGVVPEIASRQHTTCISQLVKRVLAEAGDRPDVVAATNGPGLMGSLLVGCCFAKSLAFAWNTPFVPVHHIEGHIFASFLEETPPTFPFLALVVSGGHTCLIQCERPHHYQVLGSTRDDAVGECFDKVARLLSLPYPGGPSIQKAAEDGDPNAIALPIGLGKDDSLDFSYSGLKTAVLYAMRQGQHPPLADMAASFQYAAIEALLLKTKRAIAQINVKRLVLAGGVAANRLLRQRLTNELGIEVFMPSIKFCIDNGAMIAAAASSRFEHGLVGDWRTTPSPNWPLQ